MKICHKYFFLIDYYVVFVVVFVAAVLAFVVDVAAAEFDVVISADVAVVVFHLVAVLILFVVATVDSDFEINDGDFAVAWYCLEVFIDYFGGLDDVVESVLCWLYLRVLVDLALFV